MARAPARRGSSLSRLVAHGGIYTVARVASQLAAFLLLPLYTHVLGARGLGVIEVANAARGVLMFVLLQGLHGAWFRLRYGIRDPEQLKRFETSILWYLVLSNVALIAAFSVFGAGLWNALAPGVPYHPFGLLVFVSASSTGLGLLVERKLQAEQRVWAFAGFTLARTVGTLACIVIAVAALRRGARGKLEAEAFAGVLGAVAAWVLLRPGPPRQASSTEVKRALAYGWPLVPHGVAGLANDMIDRFMVNGMLGLSAAGVYSLGYRVATVGQILMASVNQALAPIFIEGMVAAESETDPHQAQLKRGQIAHLCLAVIALGAIVTQGVAAFAPEVIALLADAGFAQSWRVAVPVSAGMLATVCYWTLSQALTYDGRGVRKLPWVTAMGAAANIATNAILIPRFHVEGAAYATLISNSTMAALAGFFATRATRLPYAWSRIFASLGLAGAGFFVLTWIELQPAGRVVRIGEKIAWLLAATALTARIAQLRPEHLLRLRRRRA